jgi:uncharacterized protein (DUF433 family)
MSRRIISRYILMDDAIRDGQPVVRGTDMTVAELMDRVASGMAWETIIRQTDGALSYEAIRDVLQMAHMAFVEHTGVPAKEWDPVSASPEP